MLRDISLWWPRLKSRVIPLKSRVILWYPELSALWRWDAGGCQRLGGVGTVAAAFQAEEGVVEVIVMVINNVMDVLVH